MVTIISHDVAMDSVDDMLNLIKSIRVKLEDLQIKVTRSIWDVVVISGTVFWGPNTDLAVLSPLTIFINRLAMLVGVC